MNTDDIEFIYKLSWFKNNRCLNSHTDMYVLTSEETKWVFETEDWFLDKVRVEYIMVKKNTRFHQSALSNHKIFIKK